jgi:glycosyltransferase involved in cell wall biosynthesis
MPTVSVLCPTRDRRAFLPGLLAVWSHQDWPADDRELIVVDDGQDRVGDVFAGLPNVRYEHLGVRVPLGTKRNRLCELAAGSLLVNFDDDDWSPPDRISRSVACLQAHGVDVVGKSELAFWNLATDTIHVQPKIGARHATAGSMTFRRSWWEKNAWRPDPHTEERQFLANFTAPLAQLDRPPWELVLAIAHGGNTLPKNTAMPRAGVTLDEVVSDPALRALYRSLREDEW